ncbi:aspartate/glutamate racemase family protein [Sphingobacterium hotanense]|uniref:Amino acid racemase n=2 Tax=Sphingobacterium TaxID=28453 RepID=A0ABT7NSR8_9SPHI|nr:amino acid racemase [Sphingobacterium hotanense]MDM1050290.1 amino acid racemase [Sphingobacterium hotanense]
MIGIIGGLGPLAGIDIVRKIIEETNAQNDQGHLPVLLSSQPNKIPNRVDYLLGLEPRNPGIDIANIAIELEKAGATVIGMPSNTAHTGPIFDTVKAELTRQGSQVRFLNMIDEVADYINEVYPGKAVSVLVTNGTKNNGLYKNSLEAKGIPFIDSHESLQEKIHEAIYDKTYGLKHVSPPVTNRAHDALVAAIQELKGHGAELIIMGCTDIPMALREKSYYGLPVLDPNRILARALIRTQDATKLKDDVL